MRRGAPVSEGSALMALILFSSWTVSYPLSHHPTRCGRRPCHTRAKGHRRRACIDLPHQVHGRLENVGAWMQNHRCWLFCLWYGIVFQLSALYCKLLIRSSTNLKSHQSCVLSSFFYKSYQSHGLSIVRPTGASRVSGEDEGWIRHTGFGKGVVAGVMFGIGVQDHHVVVSTNWCIVYGCPCDKSPTMWGPS